MAIFAGNDEIDFFPFPLRFPTNLCDFSLLFLEFRYFSVTEFVQNSSRLFLVIVDRVSKFCLLAKMRLW